MLRKNALNTGLTALAFSMAAATYAPSSAAVTTYIQDFEALNAVDASALGPFGAGFTIFADVWGSATGDATVGSDIFLYSYGPFGAPNNYDPGGATGTAFSNIAGGEGGAAQGAQYLNVFSDYDNPDQAAGNACGPTGCTINTSVFVEQTIDAADIGSTWRFEFDAKSPSAGGISDAVEGNGGDINNPQSASAFIKTLDPNAGYATTNDLRADMTNISNTDWGTFVLEIDLSDPLLNGQIIQFGFNTVSSLYDASGVYYDNICWTNDGGASCPSAVIPIPAAVWLFGSGLLGLVGVARRRKG
jgi:hypothetical protein